MPRTATAEECMSRDSKLHVVYHPRCPKNDSDIGRYSIDIYHPISTILGENVAENYQTVLRFPTYPN